MFVATHGSDDRFAASLAFRGIQGHAYEDIHQWNRNLTSVIADKSSFYIAITKEIVQKRCL